MDNNEPYLYVLARSDLASMNPGKLAAQACHAANKFWLDSPVRSDKWVEEYEKLQAAWADQGDGFGVTIVLDVKDEQMIKRVVEQIITDTALNDIAGVEDMSVMYAGAVHDPSYPIRDGGVTHLIPLTTCAYAFGRKCDMEHYLGGFSLYP